MGNVVRNVKSMIGTLLMAGCAGVFLAMYGCVEYANYAIDAERNRAPAKVEEEPRRAASTSRSTDKSEWAEDPFLDRKAE